MIFIIDEVWDSVFGDKDFGENFLVWIVSTFFYGGEFRVGEVLGIEGVIYRLGRRVRV